ncbi:MAG: GDP-mannose 4,6-dehydratase [Anaerolineae bacterium]|nr:GDP-mannose 4,6-dehydratase [Anaerolineae bacterium]
MREWENCEVLVTGAGGFIGSHLLEALLCQGARVTAFLHYNSRGDPGLLRYADLPRPGKTSLGEVQLYYGDLRDPQAVQRAMAGVRVVFHLGALIGIPYSYLHPYDVVQTNILGTLNVLMAARETQVARVVHTSTSEVYGTALYTPIDERHPLQGQSPYSASKIGADKLAESFHLSYGLPVTTVRPFNTYGPRQSARAVIPTIITQLLAGDHLTLGALTPKRDFTFVTDTVSGFLAAAVSEATIGEVVNTGSGQEISVGDLVTMIARLIGRDVNIDLDTCRLRPEKSEVQQLLADTRKLQQLTDWRPTVSLEQGLKWTIDWIAAHLLLYQEKRYAV